MVSVSLICTLALLASAGAAFASGRARALASGPRRELHSTPGYHGYFVALWTAGPALGLLAIFALAGDRIAAKLLSGALAADIQALPPERLDRFLTDARHLLNGETVPGASESLLDAAVTLAGIDQALTFGAAAVALLMAVIGFTLARGRVAPGFRARNAVESVVLGALFAASAIAVLTTVGIVLSLVFESWEFFRRVSPMEFFFGTKWSPQIALRADQVGASGAFGAVPLFYGTLKITIIAMLVAAPVGLYSAIYLSEYADRTTRGVVKPLLEILAGVPTVVYGFFALLTVGPFIRGAAEAAGLDVATQSSLAAGVVMGVMIIPFVSSLSDDVINAVPQALRDGAYAMGATKSEAVRQIVLPAALPGVMGAILLAISRAIGETMIVVMAAGRAANMPSGDPLAFLSGAVDPFETVTTITVQIVTLWTGDQEFDSPKTLSAFALGLTLFAMTLVMNVVALRIVQKYREKYE